MKPQELGTCIYLYDNAFKPSNIISLIEEEASQSWGYIQWHRSPTGSNNNTKVDSYRSSLSCAVEPLLTDEEHIAIPRLLPLCREMTKIVLDLEKYIWHYRNSFNIMVTKNEGYQILKYGDGAEYRGHADHAADNSRAFSLVAFLNDVESGGELNFPLFNVSVKPKAGSVVLFPSNFPYFHYANPVGEGSQEVKYSMVSWFS